MPNALATWMRAATPAEKKELARRAGTTLAALRQLAGGYRSNGDISMSADFAGRVEQASITLKRPGLPPLTREELCPACALCPYLIACKSKK